MSDDSFVALVVRKMGHFSGSYYDHHCYCCCKERVDIATIDMDSTTIVGMAYCKHLYLTRKIHAT